MKKKLLQCIAEAGQRPIYLRVYPKARYSSGGRTLISFQIFKFHLEPEPWSIVEPGIFCFRGIWKIQRDAVISIYRNPDPREPGRKFSAIHLPVQMQRGDCQPYKRQYNLPKSEQMPKWYIRAMFRFLPHESCWQWFEDIKPPTLDRPPRVERVLRNKPPKR